MCVTNINWEIYGEHIQRNKTSILVLQILFYGPDCSLDDVSEI